MMKRPTLALLLTLALALSLLPAGASASVSDYRYGDIPIWIGDAEVDYMAEEILKEIPTAGKSKRDQIQAVYDWIILHCKRDNWDGTYYFDQETVYAASGGAFLEEANAKLSRGEIMLRLAFEDNRQDSWFIPYDSNMYISSFGREMMYRRTGNCAHYSALLAVLLGHLGFDCRLVDGVFINGNGSKVEHKWNYVLLDGQYYWLDVRMDHANYVRSGKVTHSYFMKSDTAAWAKSHEWDHTLSDWVAANVGEMVSTYERVAVTRAEGPWACCSDWARDVVKEAGEAGVLPESLGGQDMRLGVSRQEFAAIAVNLYEALGGAVPTSSGSPFSDTADPAVLAANALGIVKGVGEGRFNPEATLTREQAVTMLGRACEAARDGAVGDGSGLLAGETEEMTFDDQDSLSGYARNYIAFFAGRGIVSGTGGGRFAPGNTMTREQAAKVAAETVRAFQY